MNTLIFLFAIFGSSFALDPLMWSKIFPNYAFIPHLINIPFPDVTYIINGRESQPNSRPYQVALIIDGMYLCGASLISSNYVLTAAHCLKGFTKFQVILGAHNFRKQQSTQYLVDSSAFNIHPQYNVSNLKYDIGLIKLPESVQQNKYIQPISLASTGDFEGAKVTASGWGDLSERGGNANHTLHEVDLTVISNESCRKYYRDDFVTDFTLCTSGMGTVGICQGDSGGPLVLDNVLIGINSFSSRAGCESGHPSGYVRITALRNWIAENSDV